MIAYKIMSFCLLLFLGHDYVNAKYFFRNDYTYLESTLNFYKIHPSEKTWSEAKDWCDLEGASLFFPSNKDECDSVISLWTKEYNNLNWIFLGATDLLVNKWFETIDGTPVEDLYNKWNPGEPNSFDNKEHCVTLQKEGGLNDLDCNKKLPFICVKSLDSIVWDISCNMPDLGYKYDDELGKCYKVHTTPTSWNDAYIRCRKELSYLAVINNEEEVEFLKNITVKGSEVYLGFHNVDGNGWKTVDGKPLSISPHHLNNSYNIWGINQPDNPNIEKCGSMFDNGQLNDLHCEDRKLPFICEHNVVTRMVTDEKFIYNK